MHHLKLIFMGTPAFAVPSLEVLFRQGYNIAAVVTAPDKPQGRGQKTSSSPIKQFAVEHQLPILQPENLKDPVFLSALQSYQANLQVVVAFRMLPSVVWAMPSLGTVNLHASLLPQYRGAAPINWAIINGEEETGVTTFFIEEAMDTGHILFQEKEPIHALDTVGTLSERLQYKGAQLLLKTVQAIEQGTAVASTQPSLAAHLLKKAPKIYKADCQINWNQSTAAIINFIRGLSPYPGAWTLFQDHHIKILAASPVSISNLDPGTMKSDGKHYLYMGTQDGAIAVDSLQAAGKKPLDISSFLRGHQVPV
jgi:methionyl-tRNA formyltransferase